MTDDTEPEPNHKSEAVTAPTVTASEAENPVDQTKNSDSAENVDVPLPQDKDDKAVPTNEAEGGHGEVTVAQAKIPVPVTPVSHVDGTLAPSVSAVPVAPGIQEPDGNAGAKTICLLSQEQKDTLASLEALIDGFKKKIIVAFFQMITAFHRIREEELCLLLRLLLVSL